VSDTCRECVQPTLEIDNRGQHLTCNIWWTADDEKVQLSEGDLAALHALRRGSLLNKVLVFRYQVYDASRDDFVTSTRMATRNKVERIGGEIIPGSDAHIDANLLKDEWTEKNFDPKKQ
jgi:hypothetical protein